MTKPKRVRVAQEVLDIIKKSPGLTGGEVYRKYKALHPDTERSRNEIAKRISDLRGAGVVEVNGRTCCPETGRLANRWQASKVAAKPKVVRPTQQQPQSVAPETEKSEPTLVPERFSAVTVQMASALGHDLNSTKTLKTLRRQAAFLWWFRFLLPKAMRQNLVTLRGSLNKILEARGE